MENDNEKSIQRLIMEISRMYVEKCFGKLKGLGIHPRQMPILAVLWKEDGCSQKELASQLGVKRYCYRKYPTPGKNRYYSSKTG